ncbi:hypothetical protein ABZ793_17345 [Micromonospora sp. NPDC047465]|uniref:hypothetical protein n=1 Tax=Micromonospora sp. NPDC047465 TaxID=3154813 RepID=UPI00340B6977
MTSSLEQRYRRLLTLLPASYRRKWEDDMVRTFLECVGAEEDTEDAAYLRDHGRPDRDEVLSVLALATRLRLGGVGAEPRSRLRGDAIRAVALLGLLFHAVTAAVEIGVMPWLAGDFLPLPTPPTEPVFDLPGAPWRLAFNPLGLFAIAAFVALAVNQPRPARWLAAVPLVADWVARTYEAMFLPGGTPPTTTWLIVLVNTGLVLALVAFHREAPPVRTRAWIRAFVAGVLLSPLFVIGMWTLPVEQELRFAALDWPGLCALSVSAAGIAYLVLRASAVARAAHWPLTLLFLGLAALALRGVSVADYVLRGGASAAVTAVCAAEAAILLVVCLPLAMLAQRATRELSVNPADVPG